MRRLRPTPQSAACAAERRVAAASASDRQSAVAHERFVRLVRATALPPDAADVATMLLLARAVEESGLPLATILQRLSIPAPIVAMNSQVAGFEGGFMRLLRDGLVMPFPIETQDGYGIALSYGSTWREGLPGAKPIVAFRSRDPSYPTGGRGLAADVAHAVGIGAPILAIAEGDRVNPGDLETASNVRLTIRALDAALVARVIAEVLGPVRDDLCEAIGDCSRLRISDLAAAIRPGVDPQPCRGRACQARKRATGRSRVRGKARRGRRQRRPAIPHRQEQPDFRQRTRRARSFDDGNGEPTMLRPMRLAPPGRAAATTSPAPRPRDAVRLRRGAGLGNGSEAGPGAVARSAGSTGRR